MSALAYILAILLGVLCAFGVHRAWTLPLAVAAVALGLLLSLPYIEGRIR